MPKVKKKSDKQQKRQDKVRKREERAAAALSTEVSNAGTGCNMSDVNTVQNCCDASLRTSNSGELINRNSAVVNSAAGNGRSAQAIVDRYLQSQKELARRFNI